MPEQQSDRREHFDPKNHPYTIHSTYKGPGCAICGKEKELHGQQT